MSERVTVRDLEGLVRRVNNAVNGAPGEYQEEWPLHTRGPSETEGGMPVYSQIPWTYYLDGAYGGYALYRNCGPNWTGESHGVSDVFGGHMPKRDLYYRLHAFLEGIESVRP